MDYKKELDSDIARLSKEKVEYNDFDLVLKDKADL